MTAPEKEKLVKRLQAGKAKARANRPERLAAVERRMDTLGLTYQGARSRLDYQLMAETRRELALLGAKRSRLQEGL